MNTPTAEAEQQAQHSLDRLAERVNVAHSNAVLAQMSVIEWAREAGDALNEAKRLVPHGQFQIWVEARCTCGYRMAGHYRNIAEHWPLIEAVWGKAANRKRVSEMSLREALRTLHDIRQGERPRPTLPAGHPAGMLEELTRCQQLSELPEPWRRVVIHEDGARAIVAPLLRAIGEASHLAQRAESMEMVVAVLRSEARRLEQWVINNHRWAEMERDMSFLQPTNIRPSERPAARHFPGEGAKHASVPQQPECQKANPTARDSDARPKPNGKGDESWRQ